MNERVYKTSENVMLALGNRDFSRVLEVLDRVKVTYNRKFTQIKLLFSPIFITLEYQLKFFELCRNLMKPAIIFWYLRIER